MSAITNEEREGKTVSTNLVRGAFSIFLSALTLVVLLVKVAPGQRVCCEGDIWLKWSPEARKTYVWGFSSGYARGYESACRKMDELWTAPPGSGPENDPLKKCLAEEMGLSKSADYYADGVTDFYSRYPGDRDISIEEVVEQLAKGLTVEQIHRYPFWRHSPPGPKQ